MATTRLGQIGVGAEPYAGFVAKTATSTKGAGHFTRLVQFGIGGAKYAGFVAKTPAEPEPEPEPTPAPRARGGGWLSPEQVKLAERIKARAERIEREHGKKREARDKRLVRTLRESYDRITGTHLPAAEQVAEAVRPFVQGGTDMALPPTQAVDWNVLGLQPDAMLALQVALQTLEQQEEDEAVMVLLMM